MRQTTLDNRQLFDGRSAFAVLFRLYVLLEQIRREIVRSSSRHGASGLRVNVIDSATALNRQPGLLAVVLVSSRSTVLVAQCLGRRASIIFRRVSSSSISSAAIFVWSSASVTVTVNRQLTTATIDATAAAAAADCRSPSSVIILFVGSLLTPVRACLSVLLWLFLQVTLSLEPYFHATVDDDEQIVAKISQSQHTIWFEAVVLRSTSAARKNL